MSSFIQFLSILYEICSGQVFYCTTKKGSNAVNTVYRVMVPAFCNSPDVPLSNYLQYFKRYAPDRSVTDGWMDGRTDKAATICSSFGEYKIRRGILP